MKRITVMLGTHFDTMGGISSAVCVYRDDGLLNRRNIEYISTHCDGSRFRKLRIMLSAWFRLARLLITSNVGIVHVHASSRASFWRKLLFLVPAILLHHPTILHLHSGAFDIFYEKDCGRLRKRLINWMFRKVTTVIVLSKGWQKWVENMCPTARVKVVYNPVKIPKTTPEWSDRTSGRVLYLGRMAKTKGTFDLLEALSMTQSETRNVSLALAGDGDLPAVSRLVEQLKLGDRVEILGWIRGSSKTAELSKASIFVLPSYHEGLPMSVLEAMAVGLPILSTPVGGIPEAVTDGIEGFLVHPGNIEQLANRLMTLAGDPDLARRMGEAAREKVKNMFSSDVIIPQIELIYDEIESSLR